MPSPATWQAGKFKTMEGESNRTKAPQREKPIQILRRRRGGIPQEPLERSRTQTKTRKKIIQALEDGPKTVPEIAEVTDVPAHEVLWKLMGMKKYGLVAEGEERDGYYQYGLKEE
jgi:predicted Rossmann fold nucleotide-binding protein DprA/Smf involved in DNA uptake